MSYVLSQFRRRPVRALGVICGVALGAALFVALAALGTGFRQAAKAPLAAVAADLLITRPAADDAGLHPAQARGPRLPFGSTALGPGEVDGIRTTAGVAAVAATLEIWDFGAGESAKALGSQYQVILGVDPAQVGVGPAQALNENLYAGRLFEPDETGVAVADRHYAAIFSLKPGDEVTISQEKFKLVGIVEQKGRSQAGVASLYIPLAQAQRLAGLGSGDVNQVYARVSDAGRVDAVVADLTDQLGSISAVSEQSILQVMGGVARISARFSQVAGIVGMAGGWALAWVAVAGLMAERQREIGVMKAVGWRRREITLLFLREFLILGLLGGLLGIALGYGLATGMGQLPAPAASLSESLPGLAAEAPAQGLDAEVGAPTLALALLVAISGVVAAGWLHVRRAARLKPSETFRSS